MNMKSIDDGRSTATEARLDNDVSYVDQLADSHGGHRLPETDRALPPLASVPAKKSSDPRGYLDGYIPGVYDDDEDDMPEGVNPRSDTTTHTAQVIPLRVQAKLSNS